ncbi:MAG: histidine phosphatase family protein [Polyangiaceae bacterium]
MLELICVRHGRTSWNAALRFQGQTNVPLDDEGRTQARMLALQLRAVPLDAAVSSDLDRCVETAKTILIEHPGVALRLDPDLREMNFGRWEGLPWAQIVEGDPKLAVDDYARPKLYTPPGGETFEDVVARASRALGRIREASPPGSRVLIATHAGVLHALLRVVLGPEGSEPQIRFSPGAVTRLALEEEGAGRLLSLNETAVADSLGQ